MGYKLSKLQTTNFRNLDPDIIHFGNGINCILGENGNGKTNILEAVHVLATRKSFRKNASFPQFLSIDGEEPQIIFSSVITKVINNSEELHSINYSGKVNPTNSNWYQDGTPQTKKPEVDVVFINPFDSYGFHNTSSHRRLWIDQHLSKLDKIYKKSLSKYTQALRFRNNLLSKKPNHLHAQLDTIDIEMAKYGALITQKRLEFLEEMKSFTKETFFQIFSEEHTLKIVLDSRVINFSETQLIKLLKERREKDLIIGHTSYFIHKDDYVLLYDGLNSYDFCSLGQQKMSYLSLLFAYINLFRYKFNTYPIVLIDDVSGELDQLRWKKLIGYLEESEFQTLITTANERFREELENIAGVTKIYVDQGSIRQ